MTHTSLGTVKARGHKWRIAVTGMIIKRSKVGGDSLGRAVKGQQTDVTFNTTERGKGKGLGCRCTGMTI